MGLTKRGALCLLISLVIFAILVQVGWFHSHMGIRYLSISSRGEDMILVDTVQSPMRTNPQLVSDQSEDKTDHQDEFKRTLAAGCRKLHVKSYIKSTISRKWFRNIIVDDEYKVIYCPIPKVATTNWKRLFLFLTGKINATQPEEIDGTDVHFKYKRTVRYLSDYPMREIRYKLKHYFKFVFVREPLERLLSGYRSKFTTIYNKGYKMKYGRTIIKRYRANYTPMSYSKADDVTFDEFVTYLLDENRNGRTLDIHWNLYHRICHPCFIKYDFIGKYERLVEDSNYVLDRINAPSMTRLPKKTYNHTQTANVFTDFFDTISEDDKVDLLKMFHPDYVLFSYGYPSILKRQ